MSKKSRLILLHSKAIAALVTCQKIRPQRCSLSAKRHLRDKAMMLVVTALANLLLIKVQRNKRESPLCNLFRFVFV